MSIPPVPYQTPPLKDDSGKAIAGFVLGLVGMLGWCIPLCGLPLTIVGLILSIKGLKSRQRGMAIAGVILCSIGIVLSLVNAGFGAYQGAHGNNWIQQLQKHQTPSKP